MMALFQINLGNAAIEKQNRSRENSPSGFNIRKIYVFKIFFAFSVVTLSTSSTSTSKTSATFLATSFTKSGSFLIPLSNGLGDLKAEEYSQEIEDCSPDHSFDGGQHFRRDDCRNRVRRIMKSVDELEY